MGRVLDAKLVRDAQSGDPASLRALIEATQSRLYRFCVVMCGDPVRAEDLCQEAYIKAFDNLTQLVKPESFMDWLFRSTRHLYIDQLRKEKHQAPSVSEDDLTGSSNLEESLAVHEVLSQFEPEERWLLMLIDMEGYSYQEAATHLGLTEDAVRSRLFRARKEFLEKWKSRETK